MNEITNYGLFISYNREDYSFAKELYVYLRRQGIKVWMDESDIEAGEPWQAKMEAGLHQSRVFAILLGASGYGKWQELEKDLAISIQREDENRKVIPVLIPGYNSKVYHNGIDSLHRLNFIDLRRGMVNQDALDKLLYAINKEQSIEPDFKAYLKKIAEKPIVPKWKIPVPIRAQKSDFKNALFEGGKIQRTGGENTINYEIMKSDLVEKDGNAFIVGEAGIGKTTFCWKLSQDIAESQTTGPARIIPIIISFTRLTETDLLNPHNYLIPELDIRLNILANFKGKKDLKFLFFFDGLNEKKFDELSWKKFIKKIRSISELLNHVSIIFTSRYVGLSEKLLSFCGDDLMLYEIQRWQRDQLKQYLEELTSELPELVPAFKSLDLKTQAALEVPYFAFLFVKAVLLLRTAQPSIKTIGDIFQNVIREELKGTNTKKPHINTDYDLSLNEREEVLYKLAFHMTWDETLTTDCEELSNFIPETKQNSYKEFAIHMLDSAIIRPVGEAIIDTDIEDEALNKIKIMFTHQALQEYLTARYCHQKNWQPEIPSDISNNAFWRDIPNYMISLIDQLSTGGPQKAIELTELFLVKEDFLTAARLCMELIETVRDSQISKVADRLIANLSIADAYPHSKDTFRELGEIGKTKLIELLTNSNTLEEIIAYPEFHLYPPEKQKQIIDKYGPEAERIEREWRKIGRTITILGELADKRLINDVFIARLDAISSTHLIYHILEAFLLILQANKQDFALFSRVRDKFRQLLWQTHEDPIIAAYSTIFTSMKDRPEPDEIDLHISEKLLNFLNYKLEVQDTENFDDEWWRRAHGFLVLSEIADAKSSLKLMQKALGLECDNDKTPYLDSKKFKGYKAVLPALTTSLLRMHRRSKLSFEDLKTMIITALNCERYAHSKWACTQLEILLRNICNEKHKSWVKQWAAMGLPEGTQRVISNIAYFLGA